MARAFKLFLILGTVLWSACSDSGGDTTETDMRQDTAQGDVTSPDRGEPTDDSSEVDMEDALDAADTAEHPDRQDDDGMADLPDLLDADDPVDVADQGVEPDSEDDADDLADDADLAEDADADDLADDADLAEDADTNDLTDGDLAEDADADDLADDGDLAEDADADDLADGADLAEDADTNDLTDGDLAEDADVDDLADDADLAEEADTDDLADDGDLAEEADADDLADDGDLAEETDADDLADGDVADSEDIPDDSGVPDDADAVDDGSPDTDVFDAGDPIFDGGPGDELVVNSALDLADPPEGTVTLRSALGSALSGQPIRFEPHLDGTTIELTIVGEEHTILKGEVMGMREEPSGLVSYLVGYFERDYGRSALYARKDVVIDASDLPSGITLAWTGGSADPARVLAVYGDLTMANVTVTGGHSVAERLLSDDPEAQPWTLARGGGVAVWGVADLVDCTLYDNHCVGDFDSSRDRGAYGGGLYANIVDLEGCIVSGNTVLGGGAAGGGVFSLGGAELPETVSTVSSSAITGNRISALFTYGAGLYSDGGGIGNRKTLQVVNSTIAWNVAEPAPGLPPFLLGMGYWRGGGIYMSNGFLRVESCTVVENEVYGYPRTDALGKHNLAGGIAATIGNAHGVESMVIGHSIVAGNTVHELRIGQPPTSYEHDIFTGSLLHFQSLGYNRFGVIDFSQILVPVGQWGWGSLCRRHYPKVGDEDGVLLSDVLDLTDGIALSDTMVSAGVNESEPVVLYYEPGSGALDRIPVLPYSVSKVIAEYKIRPGAVNNFLAIVLGRIEDHYELDGFSSDFTAAFEDFLETVDIDDETEGLQPYTNPSGDPILTLAATQWFGPAVTWPRELYNYPYIEFWHRLDQALQTESIPDLGPEILGDAAWSSLFRSSYLIENLGIYISLRSYGSLAVLADVDQLGEPRPAGSLGDIGAIELP